MNFILKNKLLLFIVLLAAFLRFYKLSEFPVHLGHDEVSQLYDAISIAETGKDIYGNPYPFIFKSVNDYKAPFYIYATSVAYRVFGWQEFTARVVGAFFGTLAIFGVYFFVNEFLKSKEIALTAAFLTAISPFEVFYSRKSFENQAGIFLVLLGFTLLKRNLPAGRQGKFFWGLVVLGISSYIYFAQAVLVPILIASYFVIFWKEARKYLVKGIIVFLLVASPLYYNIYTNPDASNRSKAVFITQDASVGSRDGAKVIASSAIRYVKQFSPKYLFLDGLDMTEGKRDVGPLFPVTIPFLLTGIYLLAKDKQSLAGYAGRKNKAGTLFIFAWVLITMVPSGLTFEEYSPHRAIAVFTMLNVITAYGIYYFYKRSLTLRDKRFGKIALFGILVLLALNFAFFGKRYLVNYPIERSEALHYPYREVALYAWENYDKYDTIIFDPKFGEFAPWIGTGAHYYLAFYGHYPPEKFQKEFKIGDQKVRETTFDKFSIRAVFWPEDMKRKNTLVIASPWSLPPTITKEAKILKTFYFKTTAVAFYAIEP